MKWLFLAFLLALGPFAPAPAAAQVVSVKGGEHEGFTRLVFYFQPGRRWQLREAENGFAVWFDLTRLGLRIEDVFDKTGRERVSRLTADRATSLVRIETACDCPATAFLHRPGVLVVDVSDNPIFSELTVPEFVQHSLPPSGAYADQQVIQDMSERPASSVPGFRPDAADPPAMPHPARLPGFTVDQRDFGPSDRLPRTFEGPAAEISERMNEARGRIVGELARATSQGLLQVSPEVENAGVRGDSPMGAEASHDPIREFIDALPNARAETSIDRALRPGGSGRPLTADGKPCIPDQALAVAAWGDPDAGPAHVSMFRRQLFEEFDTENQDAAVGLTRAYIHLSFGAEAINVLDRFKIEGPNAAILRVLARIMDGESPVDPGVFADQAGCRSRAALWSALAHGELPRGMAVDRDAVLLAFSGLPLHLRRHLGPPLAIRFLERGDKDLSLALRDAIDRAPGPHGEGLQLLNASLELELGQPDKAARTFDAVAAADGVLAPEALIRRIDMAIESRRQLPAGAVESVAALAFEYRGTPIGARLARAYVLANIVENRFDEALSSLLRIETGEESEKFVFPALWSRLALGMANAEDDVVFLSAYYRHRQTLAGRDISQVARETLAVRLMHLGFANEAAAELTHHANAPDGPSPLLLARVAVAQERSDEARALLSLVDSDEARLLRAEIEERHEQFSEAAAIYGEMSETEAMTDANWRAGNWEQVALNATGPRREAALLMTTADPYRLSLAGQTEKATSEKGLIASNQARLDHSTWVRATLGDLLSD